MFEAVVVVAALLPEFSCVFLPRVPFDLVAVDFVVATGAAALGFLMKLRMTHNELNVSSNNGTFWN